MKGKDVIKLLEQNRWYWARGEVCCAKVIERLSMDLRRDFQDMKGFSPRNLLFMRAFAEAYPDQEIVKQLVSQIPWGHNPHILHNVKDKKEDDHGVYLADR